MGRRIATHYWLLLLLTRLDAIQSFPRPRGELWSNPKETKNSKDFTAETGNGYSIQVPNSYQEGNDDKLALSKLNYHNSTKNSKENEQEREDVDSDINKAIQAVFYPDNPIKLDDSDISFPEEKLPLSKEFNVKNQKEHSFIYGGHSSFQDNDNYMNDNNNILQSRYNAQISNRLSKPKEVKSSTNNAFLKSILDLKDFDLNKISLKTAFLNKAETYNITETDDKNKFFIEKKVNVSTNLKYLNSHNELANFTDFHSSILQEKVKSDNKNSFTSSQPNIININNYSLKNQHPTEKYGITGNRDSSERQDHKDLVGGQFIDQEGLLGAHYPIAETDLGGKYEDVRRITDKKTPGQDFVGGQFISYNNEYPSQPRTTQNNNHNIGAQPSDFVGGQFVGGEEISTNQIISEPVDGYNTGTPIEFNSIENKAIAPTNGDIEINNNELSSLSILGVKQNKTNSDERSTEHQKTKNSFHKKISKEPDDKPLQVEHNQDFNQGISKPTSNFQQTINEPDHRDEATVFNGVEEEHSELDSSKASHTTDFNSYNYNTTQNVFNNTVFDEEVTSTESSTLSSERFDYEDYSEDNIVGSIIDNEIEVKPDQVSEEIQGQPSQMSPNFMETTKEAVVPLDGISSERDFYHTIPETNTQMVKDVYLYAGKDDEKNQLDKSAEINDQVLNLNAEEIMSMTEEDMKENYLTEICFPLGNKNHVTLFDLLSGNLYLENNGKKIPLVLVKNPMTNCTSGTELCKLYVEMKNISHLAQGDGQYENEEDNLIARNKRQSRQIMLPLLKSQIIENKSQLNTNRSFGYTNPPFNFITRTINSTFMPLSKKDCTKQHLTYTSTNEAFKEYSQPSTTQEITTIKLQTRTKRSARASDSCGCSSLFKSTQIPSYKYFVNKRSNILTDIVVAAKHFKDS